MNKKFGRKLIICNRCSKEKVHFGLNMCSSCLRRTKRETRPSFYLGTCYSEMNRRVKTFDLLRPNYFGKPICTKDEFINRFLNDINFLMLYKNWQENNFKRKFAPSIDRIDNEKGYLIPNLQFTTHYINSTKDFKIPLILIKDTSIIEVESCTEAALLLKTKRSMITRHKNMKKPLKGWYIHEL